MKYLIIFTLLALISCNNNSRNMDDGNITIDLQKEEVRKAIMYNYDFFDENDLSDSLTFDRYKALFSDNFVLGPSAGKALTEKETVLEGWRKIFKENKAKFDLTINRIDVSGNLAYALYHYDEKLTNINTGALYFEVTQSAIAILKKDDFGKWKFEALKYD